MPQKITSRGLDKHIGERVCVDNNRNQYIIGELSTKHQGRLYVIADATMISQNDRRISRSIRVDHYPLVAGNTIFIDVVQERLEQGKVWVSQRPYVLSN